MARLRNAVRLLGGLVLAAAPAAAQETALHATLRGWADETWLILLDRNGASDGRLGERGILQRWHELIDDKYHLDVLTSRFGLAEDSEWYASEHGARWWTGSITKRYLVMRGAFRTRMPLSDRWSLAVRFDRARSPEADRRPVRLALRRTLTETLSAAAEAHIDFDKPGTDLGLGLAWRAPSGATASVDVTVLDAPNDMVYLNLDAVAQPLTDSTIEYERQPIALRAAATVPLSEAVRIEAYGSYLRPATVRAYEGRDAAAGFRQEERFGYLGALLEWTPRDRWMLGAFATSVWARTDRAPLSASAPVDAYRLAERTTQVGGLVVTRLSRRWRLETWLRNVWRPERRAYADPVVAAARDVDFLLRLLEGQSHLTYTAQTGFTASGGIALKHAAVPRGAGQVPATGSLAATHRRFRYDVGWRRRDGRVRFLVGSAFDLDENRELSFGGARGRLMVLW